ncbi:MAG: zinc-binding dehydrogenase, partial [Candidatus Bathyarchaeia archaeon]
MFDEHGGVEKLQYRDVPTPQLSSQDVLIKVRASGCNFNDVWARRGMPGLVVPLPHISGSDLSGVVEEVGKEVTDVQVGQEVVIHPALSCRMCEACTSGEEYFCRRFKIYGFQTGPLDGGHAEYARLPQANVIPKPKGLSFEEAASIPLVLLTAWHMLVGRAHVKAGDFVLVLGAAGGLGVMAVQVAKLFNAKVIAVARSDEKLKKAAELGADYLINGTTQNMVEEVRRVTNKRGVDIVFEHVGQVTWEQSILSLKWGGTVVTCGATTGFEAKTDIRFLWNKQLNLLGSHQGTKAELLQALRFVESGDIKPVVHAVLPLSEAA